MIPVFIHFIHFIHFQSASLLTSLLTAVCLLRQRCLQIGIGAVVLPYACGPVQAGPRHRHPHPGSLDQVQSTGFFFFFPMPSWQCQGDLFGFLLFLVSGFGFRFCLCVYSVSMEVSCIIDFFAEGILDTKPYLKLFGVKLCTN